MVRVENKSNFPDNPIYFKEEAINDILMLSEEMLDISRIVDMIVEPTIVDMRLIETTEGVSHEGQIATGYKIMVSLKLREKLLYIGEQPSQPIQGVHFEIPHSFSISVPKEVETQPICNLLERGALRVDTYIEKVYTRKLDCRAVQCCLLIFLNLVVK